MRFRRSFLRAVGVPAVGAVAVAVVLNVTMTACSQGDRLEEPDLSDAEAVDFADADAEGSASDSAASSTKTSEKKSGKAGESGKSKDAWVEEYKKVLANPGRFKVDDAARYTPTGDYSYALVEANGDGTPELLLAVEGTEFCPVIIFTIGRDGKAVASSDNLMIGIASAGGDRFRIESSESGKAIYQVDSKAGSDRATSRTFRLKGSNPEEAGTESQDNNALLADHQRVVWTPSDNTDALEDGLDASVGPDDMVPGGRNGTDLVKR